MFNGTFNGTYRGVNRLFMGINRLFMGVSRLVTFAHVTVSPLFEPSRKISRTGNGRSLRAVHALHFHEVALFGETYREESAGGKEGSTNLMPSVR